MPVRKFNKDIWPILSCLFVAGPDGRLTHRKVELLRAAKEAFRGKCSEAGKLGNGKRWGIDRVPDSNTINTRSKPESGIVAADCRLPIADCKTLNTCASGDARERGLDLSIDEPPFETTEPGALFPDEPKKPAKAVDGLTPQQDIWFGIWWAAYWRHVAKIPARKAFAAVVKNVDRFGQVMVATRAQTAEMLTREPQHRPHGATWLRQERWTDEAAVDVEPTPKPAYFDPRSITG